MQRGSRLITIVAALTLPLASAACSADDKNAGAGSGAAETLKVGFITKFPVDFYDIMVDAVKKSRCLWDWD